MIMISYDDEQSIAGIANAVPPRCTLPSRRIEHLDHTKGKKGHVVKLSDPRTCACHRLTRGFTRKPGFSGNVYRFSVDRSAIADCSCSHALTHRQSLAASPVC